MSGSDKGKNVWTDGQTTPIMAPYISVMLSKVHVLLADHDPTSLLNTATMLKSCRYKVTYAENASAAIAKLSSGFASRFDVVMADIDSPDLQGHALMSRAISMGIPTVVLSCDNDVFKTRMVIEQGALFYIMKPVPIGLLQYLWQAVMKEKMQRLAGVAIGNPALINSNTSGHGVDLTEPINPVEQSPNMPIRINNNVTEPINAGNSRPGHIRSGNNARGNEAVDTNRGTGNDQSRGKKQRNTYICWDEELCEKFDNAVETLGDGNCFPKKILEVMNVPGLTRMQVASRLQQSRRNSPPSTQPGGSTGTWRSRPANFGVKPTLTRKIGRRRRGSGSGSQPNSEPAHEASGRGGGLENLEAGASPVAQQDQPVPVPQQTGVGNNNDQNAGNAPSPLSPSILLDDDDDFLDQFPADDMEDLIKELDDAMLPHQAGFTSAPAYLSGGYHQYNPNHFPQNNANPGGWIPGASTFEVGESSNANAPSGSNGGQGANQS